MTEAGPRLEEDKAYQRQFDLVLPLVVVAVLGVIAGAVTEIEWGSYPGAAERAAGYYDVAVQSAVSIGLVAARIRGSIWAISVVPIAVAAALDIVCRIIVGYDATWLHITAPGLSVSSALLTAYLAHLDATREITKRGGIELSSARVRRVVGGVAVAALLLFCGGLHY
ncbi:hypothetical protein [Curtobacterium sp. MCBD17_040]|uniref:hypothetical protein n=1 Tax=Curtobacterium sp. MCBD17_040 TaxID=2175674 RepID=UPI000DA747BF|nr:hypothetical protein [Curtobacterium sp. MCBD17_040]WIB65687.1 hypothetical protein DEI94_16330 [Curtobacterium sp. MCBD17_040]